MATGIDIVTRARQRLRIQASEEPLQAHELEEGFLALNDMLFSWTTDHTISGFRTGRVDDVVHVLTKDGQTLTNEANIALISNLALHMSDMYGVEPGPAVVAAARDSFNAIEAMRTVPDAQYETTLTYMPSQRFYDGLTGDED